MHRLKFFLLFGACLAAIMLVVLSVRKDPVLPSVADQTVVPSEGSTPLSSDASTSSLTSSAAKPATKGAPYADADVRTIGHGQRMVLFFAKAQDPFSAAHHALLTALSASGKLTVPTYRIDFDSATGSRLGYGVFASDTFVTLGGSGQRLSIAIHPTDDEVRSLLTSTHP